MIEKKIPLSTEQDMVNFAKKVAKLLPNPFSIYLSGQLGAGKTTFVRALLTQLGVTENIKSPTYSLIESYETPQTKIFHLDLYRLSHPEELDFIGFSDYVATPAIILIEWPEQAESYLPPPDLLIKIEIDQTNRILHCVTHSDKAEKLLNSL